MCPLFFGRSDFPPKGKRDRRENVAGLAGIIPALAAARGSVVAMIESTGQATITIRPPAGGVIGIAWRELRGQWRAEAALAAFAIALGAATLAYLCSSQPP